MFTTIDNRIDPQPVMAAVRVDGRRPVLSSLKQRAVDCSHQPSKSVQKKIDGQPSQTMVDCGLPSPFTFLDRLAWLETTVLSSPQSR